MAAIGIRSLVITLLLLVGLVAAHARADVIYSFNQTSLTGTCGGGTPCVPPPPTINTFTVEVTDAAAANGFSIHQSATFEEFSAQPQIPLNLTGTGIVRIAFQGGAVGPGLGGAAIQSGGPGGAGYNSFSSTAQGPPFVPLYFSPGWTVGLSGGPAGISGDVSYFGLADDLSFSISPNGTASGTYVTDAPVEGCSFNPGCSFSGVMTVSTVSTPEPASLGLLTVGVAGLLALSRCRRPSRS